MPDWAAGLRQRLAELDLDAPTNADVVEELTQHLDSHYRELVDRGMDERLAEEAAWREIDDHPGFSRDIAMARLAPAPIPVQNTSHAGIRGMWDDAGFAWRRLRHAPGFALLSLATITLTIGVNTSVLSIADAVLFRPLPYRDPDQIAILQMKAVASDTRYTFIPYVLVDAINDGCPSISNVELLEELSPATVTTPAGPKSVPMAQASENYFTLLGVTPAAGRVLGPADRGHEGRASMLSYTLWKNQFGADPSIVGRTVTLGTKTLDVVGILPPRFVLPSGIYFAGRSAAIVLRAPHRPGEKGGTFHPVIRFSPGTSIARAQAEVDAAVSTVLPTLKEVAKSTPVVEDVRSLLYNVGQPVLRYLVAAAGLILLLGCANLANLLLLRARRTERDTAIRLAMGATRTRLVRPLAVEALILSAAGAGLAALIGWMTFDVLLKQVPPLAYGLAPVGVSGRVVAASFAMGVLSALLFGMVPAWRAAQVDALALHRRRSSSPRRWSRTGAPMVAAQVAIAVAIAFGALVAARTFIGVLRTPLGFSPDRVAIVNVALPKETDLQAYYERVIRALRDTPDVMAAGAVAMLPFSRDAANDLGQSSTSRSRVGIVHTLPGYFEAAGISLRRGRLLRWDDARSDPDAAVISELAAAALFPGGEAIGAEFENSHGRRFHVIGVVADVRNSLSKPSEPLTYVIPDADLRSGLYVVARLRDNRARTLESLVTGLRDVTPQPPIANWWSDQIATQLEIRDPRFQLIVLGGLAAIALGLTALGVFGIVGYTVSARTREMGVRLALGASPAGLAALVIRQWLSPVVFGVALGFGLIMLGRGLAEAQFYRVNVHDPLAMTAAMAVVVVSALLAAFLPARRAAAIDPVEVLKAD